MKYAKPFLTFTQQIQLLTARGLIVNDEAYAAFVLQNVSYYRLSAYMFPFQVKDSFDHEYKPGSNFEQIASLYFFDRELRLLVFDAIERVEIAFRTQMVYHFSEAFGWNWFEQSELYSHEAGYLRVIRKLQDEIDRSGELFIKHYRKKYDTSEKPPACMTMEITTTGLIAQMYRSIKMCEPKKAVAEYFGIHPYILESWIQSMSYIRNICAHHSRLWNRILTIKPTFPQVTKYEWLTERPVKDTKIYLLLSALMYLLRIINPNTHFVNKFQALIKKYPQINLSLMGFPAQWYQEKLWESNKE